MLVGLMGACLVLCTITVVARIRLGEMQAIAIRDMKKDPLAFVVSALSMPKSVSPLGLDTDATSARAVLDHKPHQEDFAELFAAAYGAWSTEGADVASRHCGSREFALMVAGQRDNVLCGSSSSGEWAGCRGGFFTDSQGAARPTPSGTLSVDGQACLVLCARGSMCNVSTFVEDRCEYPYGAATHARIDPDLGVCPGAKHLTMCPKKYYCPTPISIYPCPKGYFCPTGVDRPFPCPPKPFAECPKDMLSRPHYYYRSFLLGAFFTVALCSALWRRLAAKNTSPTLLLRNATNDDGQADSFSRRWRRRKGCCRWTRRSRLNFVLSSSSYTEEHVVVSERETPLVNLTFHHLELVLQDKKMVDDASGRCRAGRITGIVGPSGAGKSSLLSLLAGRTMAGTTLLKGCVRYNGVDAKRVANGHVLSSLVAQSDESLIPWMTVFEILAFYASIRGNVSKASSRRIVERVMTSTNLTHLARSRIGRGFGRDRGLSGGERKRVHVAVELVTDVAILLLDEPLTGLDSGTSLDVLSALRAAAKRGTCVVAVLHQPGLRAWNQIDDCIVVAERGRVAYVGETKKAADYFQRCLGRQPADDVSPAEFVIDSVMFMDGDESPITNFVAESSVLCISEQSLEDNDTSKASLVALEAACLRCVDEVSWWNEFGLFAWRGSIEVWRHTDALAYDILVHGATGALIGALFPRFDVGDSQQVGFMVQLSLGFTICLSSARVFGNNRETTWRELSTAGGMGLRSTAFAFAKFIVVDVPRLSILVATFLAMWYPAASPPLRSNGFARMYAPCFAASFAASGVAHLLNVAQGPKTAQLSTVAFLIGCAVCSGVTPTLRILRKRLPVAPATILVWFSYSRWLVEALFSADIFNLTTAWHYPPTFYKNPRKESTILQLMIFDYDANSALLNAGILVFLGVLFRALAIAALKATNRDKMGLPPLCHSSCCGSSRRLHWPSEYLATSLLRSASRASKPNRYFLQLVPSNPLNGERSRRQQQGGNRHQYTQIRDYDARFSAETSDNDRDQ